MNSFDNREKAEENKYAHDREMDFLVNARYHKLIALWVAEKAGFDGAQTEHYKNTFVSDIVEKEDEETLLKKIRHELLVHDVHITDHDIREEMYRILQTARAQLR